MNIQLTPGDKVTVVTISGSVDGLTADRLQSALDEQLMAGVTRLVADCSGVTYTSSAGLRAFLGSVKHARTRGGDLRLASVQPPVLRVLELAGFTSIIKVFPDVGAATASFD
jgi:anti-sigma B factor antagonist